jgi:hypothetical protein
MAYIIWHNLKVSKLEVQISTKGFLLRPVPGEGILPWGRPPRVKASVFTNLRYNSPVFEVLHDLDLLKAGFCIGLYYPRFLLRSHQISTSIYWFLRFLKHQLTWIRVSTVRRSDLRTTRGCGPPPGLPNVWFKFTVESLKIYPSHHDDNTSGVKTISDSDNLNVGYEQRTKHHLCAFRGHMAVSYY